MHLKIEILSLFLSWSASFKWKTLFCFNQQRLYKASFEKNRGNFKYTSDTPFFEAAKNASILINNVSQFNLVLSAAALN